MKKVIKIIILVCVVALVVMVLWIRFAPISAEKWHVNPTEVIEPQSPNYYLKTYSIDATISQVLEKFTAPKLPTETIKMLSGSIEGSFATYVARTPLMGYPDMISVSVVSLGENQTQINVFSRSRFGYADLGRNKQRVEGWIDTLRQSL